MTAARRRRRCRGWWCCGHIGGCRTQTGPLYSVLIAADAVVAVTEPAYDSVRGVGRAGLSFFAAAAAAPEILLILLLRGRGHPVIQ